MDLTSHWQATNGLPSRTTTEASARVLTDLHRLDGHPVAEVVEVVTWIIDQSGAIPTYLRSPVKLRRPTRAGDETTYEHYRTSMRSPPGRNGHPAKSADGDVLDEINRRYRDDVAQYQAKGL